MTYYLTLRVEILNSEEGDDDDDEEDFEAQAASMSEEQVEELRGVCIQTLEQMPMDEEQRVGEFCVLSRCRLCLSQPRHCADGHAIASGGSTSSRALVAVSNAEKPARGQRRRHVGGAGGGATGDVFSYAWEFANG
jgi:hypothetical protein